MPTRKYRWTGRMPNIADHWPPDVPTASRVGMPAGGRSAPGRESHSETCRAADRGAATLFTGTACKGEPCSWQTIQRCS